MRGRSVYLLGSLLALVALGPWLTDYLVGRAVWELLFTLVAFSSVRTVGVTQRQALLAGGLSVPALAALWLRQLIPDTSLSGIALALLVAFLLYMVTTVLVRVFREATVTLDTLSAALCVYLLMGFLWANVYGLLYLLGPGNFQLPRVGSRTGNWGSREMYPSTC